MGLVAFLLVVATTPPSRPWTLAGQGLIAAAVAVAALVTRRDLVPRLALDLPLAVLAATLAVAGSGPRAHGLSSAGLEVGLALLAKATIGIVSVSAVAASTTADETVAGLRRLRLPPWLCDLVALTARQVQVLGDELRRLRLAAAIRAGTGSGRRRNEWSAVARALGVLFVRGVERADRLQVALAARGGPPPTETTATSLSTPAADPKTTSTRWLPALVPAIAALGLRLALGA